VLALRAALVGSLASGYPLHHLLRGVAASQVVPLLSLSQTRHFVARVSPLRDLIYYIFVDELQTLSLALSLEKKNMRYK